MGQPMHYEMADLFVMAKTIGGESRGEPYEGQCAVGWVIRNRVEIDLNKDGKPDWWGEGITEVCKKPKQFDCWDQDDPNLPILTLATFADPWYVRAFGITCGIVMGDIPDYSQGATHYYDKRAPEPYWAVGKTPVAGLGHHLFFRLV